MTASSWYDPAKKRYGAEVAVDERDLLMDRSAIGEARSLLAQKIADKVMERVAPLIDRIFDEALGIQQ